MTAINEMAGASEIAFSLKDPKVVLQAANHVTLMNVLVQMGIAEKIASAVCYFARKRDSDHEELSDETRESLERRLDPCIRETNRTTVTSVTYVPGTTQTEAETIWCGLGSGTIIVYEIEEWTIVSELRLEVFVDFQSYFVNKLKLQHYWPRYCSLYSSSCCVLNAKLDLGYPFHLTVGNVP